MSLKMKTTLQRYKKKRLFLKIKFMNWFVCTVCTDVIECFVEEEGKLHTYLLTCTYTYLLTACEAFGV